MKISDIWNGINIGNTGIKFNPLNLGSNPSGFSAVKRNLPNGGGSYTAPVVQQATTPVFTPRTEPVKTSTAPIFSQNTTQAPADTTQTDPHWNPKAGTWYTPDEYANLVMSKIPSSKNTGDIGQYAGDALMRTARGLNNARNDIATGTTDPYKAGKNSGISYSPEQLSAIEKAYAGIYDPALEDVFTRLKQAEDEKKREQDRLDQIFATDENIRQWNATTGTKATSGAKAIGSLGLQRGVDGYVNWQQYIDKAREWEASGKSLEKFVSDYPPEIFINPADAGNLPSYLQPKMASATDRKAELLKEMARPEYASLTEDQKYDFIRTEFGLNPEDFGVYPSE